MGQGMERGQGLCVRVCVRARPQGETRVGGSGRGPSTLSCCVGLSVAYLQKLQEAHVAGSEGERRGLGWALKPGGNFSSSDCTQPGTARDVSSVDTSLSLHGGGPAFQECIC